MQGRALGAVVSIVLIALTASPVLRDPNDDGFPLSTYPMFAWKRTTTVNMEYLVGFTATGERWHPPPRTIGTSEPMQAVRILQRAVADGRAGELALCKAAAKRIPRLRNDIVVVAMMRGSHEAIAYLVYNKLGKETELVRCAVPGHEAEAAAMGVTQ